MTNAPFDSKQITFQVQNFRAIGDSAIDLSVGALNVLVGANNAGKTSLLEAMALALTSMPVGGTGAVMPLRRWSYRRVGDNVLRPSISFRLPTNLLHDPQFGGDPKFRGLQARFEAVLSPSRLGAHEATSLALVEMGLIEPDTVLVEPNRTDSFNDSDYTKYAHVCVDEGLLDGDHSGRDILGVGPVQRRQPFPAAAQQLHGPFSDQLRGLQQRVFYLTANRVPRYAAEANDASLTIETVMEATLLIKQLLQQTAPRNRFNTSITALFPDIEEVDTFSEGRGRVPRARYRGGADRPLAELGFGARNAIHLLTVLTMAPSRAIILIDEPELGLNQGLQRDFAALLEDLRRDITLVVATQSEGFCSGLRTSRIDLIRAAQEVRATKRLDLSASGEDRRLLAETLGIANTYLFEGGFILYVEGKSDAQIMERWLQLNGICREEHKLAVSELGGSGSVKQALLQPIFSVFHDRVLVILDSDREANSERGRSIAHLRNWFAQNGLKNLFELKRREIENYLPRIAIETAANLPAGRLGGPPESDQWFDIKGRYRELCGHDMDTKISVRAFESLTKSQQKNLFADENKSLLKAIRNMLPPRRDGSGSEQSHSG